MNNNKKVELTLPVYNEGKILKINTQKIIEYLEGSFKGRWHITIAENGSTDDTLRIAEKLKKENIAVSITQTDKGRGNAIKKAWEDSNADYLIYMDIDLSTQPKELSKLISSLEKSDVSIGSRFLAESTSKRTIGRKFISKIYNFLANKILGLKIKDLQCGFKGITKKSKFILKEIKNPHWFFDTELIYKAKNKDLRISEVPIFWNERQEESRKSKVNIFYDSIIFIKNIFKLKFENKILLPAILIFTTFSLLIFFIVMDSNGALCPDSFYHAKIAQTIWETKSLVMNFPWLPFTILGGENFVDHHMIYHIISAPFIGIFGFNGLKIVTSVLAGGVFATLYVVLKRFKIKLPLIWIIIAFATPAFIYRIILFRAISLSIILLLMGFYFIYRKNYFLLFLTSLIFVWSYNAFPLLLIFGLIYLLSEKIINKKYVIKPLIIISLGILTGIIVNPYFPQNINFYKIHLFIIPFLNGVSMNYRVGSEWYPMPFTSALQNLTVIWLIFCISLAALLYNSKNRSLMKIETLFTFFISLMFFIASLKSQRFVEYWVPFAIISSALIFRDLGFDSIFINFIKKMYKKAHQIQFLSIMIVPIIFILFVFASAKDTANSTPPYNRLEMSSEWIKNNIPNNRNIINVSWDTFPELYYWNNKNNYAVGMDLMFLCSYDKEKCDIYNKLAKNDLTLDDDYLKKFESSFNTDIILVSNSNNKYEDFKKSTLLTSKYHDEAVTIFQINK